MKRLTTIVALSVIVALVSPSFVLAQGGGGVDAPTPEHRRARGRAGQRGPGGRPVVERPRMDGMRHLFRVALLAARAREDAELQTMVDKAIQDRKHLLRLEAQHIGLFEELVAAIRAEDKELARTKSEELKAVRENISTKTRKLGQDIRAIAKRLREIMPELGEKPARGFGARPGPARPGGRVRGKQGERGTKPGEADDLPLDIY